MHRTMIVAGLLSILLAIPLHAQDDSGFVDLFNGQDLAGWTQRNGTATYRVEGDSIVGQTSEGSPNSFLCTDKLYGDFELTFDVKVDSALNSGVQIRSQCVGDTPEGRVNGPQVEISLDGMAGYVYGEAAGGWMTPDEDRKPHELFRDGEWNSYRVLAVGNKIETWLNGQQVSNLTHEEKFETHPTGFIGLQVHGVGSGQGPFEVRWRNLKLRDLSEIDLLNNDKDLSDWRQWRGNNRDGLWNENGITESFTAESLEVLWSQDIEAGYSGPTVAHGRVFVMDRQSRPEQRERVLCFDSATGEPLWNHTYDAAYVAVGYVAGPRASVSIDQDRAYALGTMGNIHCLNVNDGSVVWQRDLNEEYGFVANSTMPIWGIAASPLVYNDLLILHIGGSDGACVVGLDKITGEERWRTLDDRAQYSSPIIIQQNGHDVLVCWTGDSVAGIDPNDGIVRWRFEFTPQRMPIGIATPVVKDNQIFVTSFYDGSLMLRLSPDSFEVEKVWSAVGPNEKATEALQSLIGTPVWIDEHIYGADSFGELRCIRASDGQRVWEDQSAVPNARWSTIHMVQNGESIWMFNERGELILGNLSPAGFTETCRAKIIEPTTEQLRQRGGVCWSHPAFANRCVFVRNDKRIVCISLED